MKRFWLDFLHRTGLKRTDKIMVGNVDDGKAYYIDIAELLSVLTTDDLKEGTNASRKYISAELKTKLENLSESNYTLEQLAQQFYPASDNPAGYLSSSSSLAAAKLTGTLTAALIPGLNADKITAGILAAARIPDLDAEKIASGTLHIDRIPQIPASKLEDFTLTLSNYVLKTAIGAANGVVPLDQNIKIATGYIPGLDAAKIVSGIFAEERIPDVYVKIADIVDNLISNDASKVASANQIRVLNEKINNLEGSKFKGSYPSFAALVYEYPEGADQDWHNNQGGWKAEVDEGANAQVKNYTFDLSDLIWVRQLGTSDLETGQSIEAKYEALPDTNKFQDTHKTKVESVETGATADQTGEEIKALYEAQADTNALTDALKNAYNSAVSWITTNGQNILDHITKWASPNVAGKVPVSQADGSIVWQDKTPNKFLGTYTSLANLQAAYPSANEGEHADVDAGPGTDVKRYIWDVDDTKWVPGGVGGTVDTSNLAKLDQINTFSQIQKVTDEVWLGSDLTDNNKNKLKIRVLTGSNPKIAQFEVHRNSTFAGWNSEMRFLLNEGTAERLRLAGSLITLFGNSKVQGDLEVTGNLSIPKIGLTRTSHNILDAGIYSNTVYDVKSFVSSPNAGVIFRAGGGTGSGWAGQIKFTLKNGTQDNVEVLLLHLTDGGKLIYAQGSFRMDALDLSQLTEATDDADASSKGVAVGYAYINSATGALHKRRS